jgi:hypothetical protein
MVGPGQPSNGASVGPPFPIGGPTTTAWREQMLAKGQELWGLASWIDAHPKRATPTGNLQQTIENELQTARSAAAGSDAEDQKKFVCPLRETPVPDPATADIDRLVSTTATGADVFIVEIVGLVAATLAGAIALRRMRGTSTPYGVPVALILLKLPAGALTAVLGLLFMRGGFVPGLTALDSAAQILAWAIIFGYAQQVFTRLVDNQGQDLLHDVAGHGPAGDRGTRSR